MFTSKNPLRRSVHQLHSAIRNPKSSSRRPARRKLLLESLENRMVMTGTVQVLLMVGQSNMGGYGETAELTTPLNAPQSDVWIWQDDLASNVGWTSLRGGFGGDSSNFTSGGDGTQFGPEVSLGRALADASPGTQYAIIKHSQAGTAATMQDGWNPDRGGGAGPGQIWIDLMDKTNEALTQLSASSLDYELAGLFVFQGNRDAVNETGVEAANYQQNFSDFIAGVRDQFSAPNMPVVFYEVPETRVVGSGDYDNRQLIRSAQAAIDTIDPLATMLQSNDSSRIEDGDHIDAAGQVIIGRRFADAYLGLPFEGSGRAGSDGFESGSFGGGFEQWGSGTWTVSGDVVVTTTGAPFDGAAHARLRSSTGDLIRAVDTTGLTNVKLRFRSKLESFESADKASVKISTNGTTWATIREFVDGQDDGVYRYYESELPDTVGSIYVRFDAQMSDSTDNWYVDNVILEGTTRGKPSAEVPTKFYVVDDGSANTTFEYQGNGAAIENYAVSSGNSAPRGAASDFIGDRVWLLDANRSVFVYNNSGGLLGSWTPGGLNNSSQLQGITVCDGDVWIVDGKTDKAYRYAGAATRLSGSQNAASSFNLNGSNTGPTDLVTDGASLWVVNDSTTDKVFKYSLAGSLLGSWTITGAGSAPTGITLDPSNPSHLWIVDSGTDRVYQFDNAVGRTSSSQSPSSSFGLASGNTNPQGIADPPPPALSDLTTPVAKSPVYLELSKITPWSAQATNRIADSKLTTALRRDVDELMVQIGNAGVETRAEACVASAMPVVPQWKKDIGHTELFDQDLEESLDLLLQGRSGL